MFTYWAQLYSSVCSPIPTSFFNIALFIKILDYLNMFVEISSCELRNLLYEEWSIIFTREVGDSVLREIIDSAGNFSASTFYL